MKPHLNKGRVFLVLGLSGILAACAGPGPRPEGEMQSAQNAIQSAQSNNAREYEPILLNDAQNKVSDAELLIEEREYHEARRLLEQAAVDAELASARAETGRAKAAAEEINRSIEQLRQQINSEQR